MGDLVDAIDDLHGAWFEGKIFDIVKNTQQIIGTVSKSAEDKNGSEVSDGEKSAESNALDISLQDDGLLYMVSFDL